MFLISKQNKTKHNKTIRMYLGYNKIITFSIIPINYKIGYINIINNLSLKLCHKIDYYIIQFIIICIYNII